MNKIHFFILLSSFTLCSSQCGNDCDNEYETDSLSLNFEINSSQFAVEIGDTVTLENIISNQIQLNESMNIVDHANEEITQFIDLFEINENNIPITNGTTEFDIEHNASVVSFIQNSNQLTRGFTWRCNDQDCQISISFIPKRTGYFGIHLSFGFLKTNSDCLNYNIRENTINVFNNNLELLNEINTDEINIIVPSKQGPNDTPGFINLEASYFFKVE